MKKAYWFAFSLLVICLDQASKYWVQVSLSPYESVAVLPFFNLTLAYNSGSAFSFLSQSGAWHQWFFTAFSLCMSIILSIWLWRTASGDRLQALGLSLILSGALGNLIDRLLYGYVIDFIDLYYKTHHFATFNLADSAICVGGFFLILSWMQSP